jgi:hypothetical protein
MPFITFLISGRVSVEASFILASLEIWCSTSEKCILFDLGSMQAGFRVCEFKSCLILMFYGPINVVYKVLTSCILECVNESGKFRAIQVIVRLNLDAEYFCCIELSICFSAYMGYEYILISVIGS